MTYVRDPCLPTHVRIHVGEGGDVYLNGAATTPEALASKLHERSPGALGICLATGGRSFDPTFFHVILDSKLPVTTYEDASFQERLEAAR